ncbi:MAG: phosphatase PAP2 family protein [bacterium]
MNSLIEFDQNITLFLNGCHSSYFDSFFFLYTDLKTWIPLILLVMYVAWRQWGIKALYFYLAVALVIFLSDQFSSSLIKPLFARPRPTHEPLIADLVHTVNGYRGGRYGFVSSHSANSFAFALLSLLLFKRTLYSFSILFWAFITAYSRVYLGVHYVGDIFFGALVGVFFAFLLYYILKRLPFVTFIRENSILSKFNNRLIIIGFMLLYLMLFIISYISVIQ